MRLSGEWVTRAETQAVLAALADAGHQAYFVGGCVRNALLGLPVSDIDIATDARPERVTELAEAAGLKAVPTGIEHGTVTVVSGGLAHEVTTFRRDVETFGRRAVVAFADEIGEDARRRDFTMNALYADARGELVDPLGGIGDLRARHIRFIGHPEDRIREDGLRILRFFRFHAMYGDPETGLDHLGLAAVAAMAGGLDPVSRERIGAEMEKLLGAADPGPALRAMAAAGVLGHVLPDADPGAIAALVGLEAETGVPIRWLRRLAALDGADAAQALRLSRASARTLERIRTCLAENLPDHAAAERFGRAVAEDAALIRAARGGGALPPEWQADIALGAAAVFPLVARDLLPSYGETPELGKAMARLRQRWVDSRFTLDGAALLAIDSGEEG